MLTDSRTSCGGPLGRWPFVCSRSYDRTTPGQASLAQASQLKNIAMASTDAKSLFLHIIARLGRIIGFGFTLKLGFVLDVGLALKLGFVLEVGLALKVGLAFKLG